MRLLNIADSHLIIRIRDIIIRSQISRFRHRDLMLLKMWRHQILGRIGSIPIPLNNLILLILIRLNHRKCRQNQKNKHSRPSKPHSKAIPISHTRRTAPPSPNLENMPDLHKFPILPKKLEQ